MCLLDDMNKLYSVDFLLNLYESRPHITHTTFADVVADNQETMASS